MQWDLWNPWATFYELNSTHPLIAHRLQYLSDQGAAMGQEPYIVFDRRKPESYWDDFAVDVLVILLPVLLFLLGLGVALALGAGAAFGVLPGASTWARPPRLVLVGLPILGLGIGSMIKTMLVYRGDYFAPLSVTGLLHKVKVSNVRPVPARLRGTIIGKGVPGLIWSEDFVMRDATGILFLDYRQPLRIWEWLFGLFRAGEFHRQVGRGRRLVPARPGAVPRAQVDHRRRRHAETATPATADTSWPVSSSWSASAWSSPASSQVEHGYRSLRP